MEGMGSHGLAIIPSPLAPTKCQREEDKRWRPSQIQGKWGKNTGINTRGGKIRTCIRTPGQVYYKNLNCLESLSLYNCFSFDYKRRGSPLREGSWFWRAISQRISVKKKATAAKGGEVDLKRPNMLFSLFLNFVISSCNLFNLISIQWWFEFQMSS